MHSRKAWGTCSSVSYSHTKEAWQAHRKSTKWEKTLPDWASLPDAWNVTVCALADNRPHLANRIGVDKHQWLSVCSMATHHMVAFLETRCAGGGENKPLVQFQAEFSNAGWHGGQTAGPASASSHSCPSVMHGPLFWFSVGHGTRHLNGMRVISQVGKHEPKAALRFLVFGFCGGGLLLFCFVVFC